MNWAAFAPFIIQNGLPAAIALFERIQKNEPVTLEGLKELAVIVNRSKEETLVDSRKRLGLPPLEPEPEGS